MKTLHLLLTAAAVVLSSCSLVENDISLGYPHKYGHRNNTRTGEPLKKDSTATDAPAVPRPDTIVYLSAVKVPADYDWQKDSAYGAVNAQLVLLRNFRQVVNIDVGPHVSAAADRHHIVDGHLCTEFQASSRTYIGIDGEEVVILDGRHELMGMIEHEGVLYTLTRPLGGAGFCLMANGQNILSRSNGRLYGSMSAPAYRPNGALYLDDGHLTFCFSYAGVAYKVVDGKETKVSNEADYIEDMRIIGGSPVCAMSSMNGQSWQDASVWRLQSGYAISGTVNGMSAVMRQPGGTRWLGISPESTIYLNENGEFALSCARDGSVRTYDTGGAQAVDGKWYFFSPACACMGPKGPAMALTPMGSTGKPTVFHDGEQRSISLNGFLTGITVTIEEN